MDEDVCRWVIEFILRSSMDDDLLKRVLAVIPIPDKDFRLKKTVLLRAIESQTLQAEITEKFLEIFEIIEQLDKTEGLAVMESMKAAYCAVAVECTAKYLVGGGVQRYLDAVKRIWRVRLTKLERLGKSELVSRELKAWKDEVEAALSDKNVRKRLMNMNTRNEALKLVTEYLGEAWAVLGPPFIRLSASLMDKGMTNDMQSLRLEQEMEVADETAIACEDVGGSRGVELPPQAVNYVRLEGQGTVQVCSEAGTKRTNLLNVNQDSGINDGSNQSIVAADTEEVQELATEAAEMQESAVQEGAVSHDPSLSRGENVRTSVLPRCKSLASHRRVRGGAKISHLDDSENDTSLVKYSCLDTPEVNRVREALKTSSLELQAVVKDPLPDALRKAEAVAHDLAEKNKNRENSLEERNDAAAANPANNKDDEPLQSENADLENRCHDHPIVAPRPTSIMERNSTARTYEWDDSIDGSPERKHSSRLHLPSPKRKAISPLKKYQEIKFVRRRKSKRWSLLEEDTLRTAVERFGKGNWKLILSTYRDVFEERTEVDLKDKWRNMTRY